MLTPIVRIEVYKKQTSGSVISYNSDPDFIIDDFINLSINTGIEKTKDQIKFSLINHKELIVDDYIFTLSGNRKIEVKDRLKVYAKYNQTETWTDDDLLMSAEVKSWAYNDSEAVAVFEVNALDRTEILLNSMMFAPYVEGEAVPNMIVDSMQKIRNYNQNDVVYAYKDYSGNAVPGSKGAYDAQGNPATDQEGNPVTRDGYIRAYKAAAYKTDNSGEIDPSILVGGQVPAEFRFPDAIFAETYKPFLAHLETISTPEYTGDTDAGVYIFFVDQDNNLNWIPKDFTNVGTLYEYNHTNIRLSKDTDEVINAVIVNCGTDPNQNGILALYYNASSMGKNGARWKYIAKTHIGERIREDERRAGDYVLENGTTISGKYNSGKSIGDDGYPTSYPWTVGVSGSDIYGQWEYVAGTTTVSSNQEYKTYFRRVARREGQKRGKDIVTYSGDPILVCNWELESGTTDYQANTIVELNIPSLGLPSTTQTTKLQIKEVSHAFSADWVTTLKMKEDLDFKFKYG